MVFRSPFAICRRVEVAHEHVVRLAGALEGLHDEMMQAGGGEKSRGDGLDG